MASLTALPATGAANFNTLLRAVLNEWKAGIESKSESGHSHGAGGEVISICQDETNLGTGSTDGEIKITHTDDATNGKAGNVYSWDHGNTKWRIHSGNAYTTEPSDSTYTVETGTAVTIAAIHYVYDGANFVTQLPDNYLTGFIMSNDTDADHDINITAGQCSDSTNTASIARTEITKQIDAVWVAGDDAGGFPSAGGSGLTLANDTWYHFFVILNPTTGAVDAGFDSNIDASVLLNADNAGGAGYTKYRRVENGSVLTDGAANIVGTQWVAGVCYWDNPPLDVNAVATGTALQTHTLSIPPDVSVLVHFNYYVSAAARLYFKHPDVDDEAPADTTAPIGVYTNQVAGVHRPVMSNTSKQITSRSSANVNLYLATIARQEL